MGTSVLVVGLGRFGSAAALELMSLGHEVLAVDHDPVRVNRIAPQVTHAMELDASDEAALRSIGAADFGHAIVAITGSLETSIFATMALKSLGVANVVAKAGSELHGAILRKVGADRVVYPEQEMGGRVAHVFNVPTALDYLDVAPNFGIVKISPPASFVGRTLSQLDLQGRLGLTPVALRRGNKVTVVPHRDETVTATDELILLGHDDRLDELGG
jgi:trk system potassium uptake protein TrkA